MAGMKKSPKNSQGARKPAPAARRSTTPSRPAQSPSMKEETPGPDINLDQLKRRQGGVDRRVIV